MKKLLSVTFFSGLLTLARMIGGFIIAKTVAVYAGPAGIAMLGQVQSVVLALTGVASAPVGSGLIRYTAEFEKQGPEACAPWWRASIWWLLNICLVVIPLGFLSAELIANWLFNEAGYTWVIYLTIVSLPLAAVGTLANSVINGYQQYSRYIVLGAISTVISSVLMVVLVTKLGIVGGLLAAAIQTGLIGLVMLVGVLRQPWFALKYWWGWTSNEHKKKIGGYILMIITSALTAPIALIGIRNILVAHVGWEQAGHWQAVWKISEAYLGVLTIGLSTYYLPRLSAIKSINAIRQEVNQTLCFVIPVVLFMALSIYFLRDIVIELLFTEEFKDARDLFAIQLAGDVVKIASWIYAYPMISRGATKWFVFSEIFFSGFLVFLCYFFIGAYGAQGANIAYVVNYTFYFIFVFINLKRICIRSV